MKYIYTFLLFPLLMGCNVLSWERSVDEISFFMQEGTVRVISSTSPIDDFKYDYSNSIPEDINGDFLVDGIIYNGLIYIEDKGWIKGRDKKLKFISEGISLHGHKVRDVSLYWVYSYEYPFIRFFGENYLYDISHIADEMEKHNKKLNFSRSDIVYIVWKERLYSAQSKQIEALVIGKW